MTFSEESEKYLTVKEAGAFLRAYEGMQGEAVTYEIESSVLGRALWEYLKENESGVGAEKDVTVGDLLNTLTACVTEFGNKKPPRGWPSNPTVLSKHLRRLSPAFRQKGWDILFKRAKEGRHIQVLPRGDANIPGVTLGDAANFHQRHAQPSDFPTTSSIGDANDANYIYEDNKEGLIDKKERDTRENSVTSVTSVTSIKNNDLWGDAKKTSASPASPSVTRCPECGEKVVMRAGKPQCCVSCTWKA